MTEYRDGGSTIPALTEVGQSWLEAARVQLRLACTTTNRTDWIRYMEEWARYMQAQLEAMAETLSEVELVQLRDVGDKTEVLVKR